MEKYIPKILIVDDMITNINLLTTIMSINGYDVISEQKGTMAFEKVKFHQPDIVLLDIMMPDMDGYEVCKRIRNHHETKSIPVIFITGIDNQKDIIKGFEVGGVDFISKPFNPIELLSRVKTHLDLKFAKDKLLENIVEKDMFFSFMASEMSNNFNSFMGLIEIFINEHKNMDSKEHEVIFMNMSNSGNLLRNFIDKLFSWSQIHSNTIEIQKINLSCKQIVDEVLFSLSKYADKKQINIENNINKDYLINVDYSHILNIIKYILHNAIKFTPKNGKVILSTTVQNRNVIISIQDSGIGIDSHDLEKIFRIDRQYKQIGTNGEKGIGLDLILANALIQLMKGSIVIDSEIGVGTTVAISFPKV